MSKIGSKHLPESRSKIAQKYMISCILQVWTVEDEYRKPPCESPHLGFPDAALSLPRFSNAKACTSEAAGCGYQNQAAYPEQSCGQQRVSAGPTESLPHPCCPIPAYLGEAICGRSLCGRFQQGSLKQRHPPRMKKKIGTKKTKHDSQRRGGIIWATPPVRLGLSGRNSGKIPEFLPETLSERFVEFPSRVRLG